MTCEARETFVNLLVRGTAYELWERKSANEQATWTVKPQYLSSGMWIRSHRVFAVHIKLPSQKYLAKFRGLAWMFLFHPAKDARIGKIMTCLKHSLRGRARTKQRAPPPLPTLSRHKIMTAAPISNAVNRHAPINNTGGMSNRRAHERRVDGNESVRVFLAATRESLAAINCAAFCRWINHAAPSNLQAIVSNWFRDYTRPVRLQLNTLNPGAAFCRPSSPPQPLNWIFIVRHF